MDGQELVERVKQARATELDRLGGEKALVAVTKAQLETAAVLDAAAAAELRALDTFEAWAEDGGPAADTFDEVAAVERTHYEAVVERRDDAPSAAEADDLHAYLRTLEDDTERIGAGLVGRSLATERTLLQFVNFFINEGDHSAADLFRGFREDTQDLVARGADLLDDLCDTDEDYDRALTAAERTIELAYEEYRTALESMGVDPKPVC